MSVICSNERRGRFFAAQRARQGVRRRRTRPGMANTDTRQDGTVFMHQTPLEKQTQDSDHAAQLHTDRFCAEQLLLAFALLLCTRTEVALRLCTRTEVALRLCTRTKVAALPRLPVTETPGHGQKKQPGNTGTQTEK